MYNREGSEELHRVLQEFFFESAGMKRSYDNPHNNHQVHHWHLQHALCIESKTLRELKNESTFTLEFYGSAYFDKIPPNDPGNNSLSLESIFTENVPPGIRNNPCRARCGDERLQAGRIFQAIAA